MSKSSSESAMLFKPLLTAGMIILAFGLICIWIGTSVISLKEEGDGPGTINSKNGERVKIIQRWDGRRPKIQYVFGDFLAHLYDRQTEQRKRPREERRKWIEYCERGALR